MKTAKLSVYVKDPDGWGHVSHALGLSDDVSRAHFEFGEYATVEASLSKPARLAMFAVMRHALNDVANGRQVDSHYARHVAHCWLVEYRRRRKRI
jgi:hypothetical protein